MYRCERFAPSPPSPLQCYNSCVAFQSSLPLPTTKPRLPLFPLPHISPPLSINLSTQLASSAHSFFLAANTRNGTRKTIAPFTLHCHTIEDRFCPNLNPSPTPRSARPGSVPFLPICRKEAWRCIHLQPSIRTKLSLLRREGSRNICRGWRSHKKRKDKREKGGFPLILLQPRGPAFSFSPSSMRACLCVCLSICSISPRKRHRYVLTACLFGLTMPAPGSVPGGGGTGRRAHRPQKRKQKLFSTGTFGSAASGRYQGSTAKVDRHGPLSEREGEGLCVGGCGK